MTYTVVMIGQDGKRKNGFSTPSLSAAKNSAKLQFSRRVELSLAAVEVIDGKGRVVFSA
ncbi:MAG: hypothetical protein JSS20_15870 [Proteobacteria bacterium]|nr:hypothetical protein [Pseudomonadota bacterium]